MSDTVSNEVVPATTNRAVEQMQTLSSGVGIMSTVKGDTVESRKVTLNAVTNADPVSDHLDETIDLVHVVTQAVTIADDKTGEERDVVRVILLSADGSAYAAVSDGLLGSLRDVFGIMGHPSTWAEPLPVKVVEKRGRSGYRFYKIELA